MDFDDTEACHQSDLSDGIDDNINVTYADAIAIAEYRERKTLLTLSHYEEYLQQRAQREELAKQYEGLYLVISDSTRDNTTLMLVDRKKSNMYWWTHDLRIALTGSKEAMERIASRLTRNNPRVVSCRMYLLKRRRKE